MRFLVRCETPAHVLKTQFAFFRYGFFSFLKGFTVVFHRKKLFRFCFNYVFFLKEFTLFFPHKKMFFFYPNFYCPQKVRKSGSKTIAHICFSFPPFGRGGGGDRFFFWAKFVSKTQRMSLKRTCAACPMGGS